MGGFISYFKKEEELDDEDENLRRYQDTLDADGTFGFSDTLDKRKVKWWERIIFDKRLRITYVFILALILGFIIPMILFMTKLESKRASIYGSCLINANARFECLINSAKVVNEKSCMKAMCCWENSDTLPFKCYHSLPSAYHYTLSNTEDALVNGTAWTTLELSTSQESGVNMPNLKTHFHWETSNQLVIEIFNPTSFPNRTSDSMSEQLSNNPRQANETDPFTFSYAKAGEFFYIKVVRSSTAETIFDTRLGPIMSGDGYISLSTVLPTEYFYGLKGGQGSLSTLTYAVVHGFENVELPFYISYEESGNWHGVLIDTNQPMLTQVVQAPGIMFHLEADRPEMNLNFFAGPDQASIVSQLYTHIRKKYNIAHPPMIPPYWGLGLHICRKIGNDTLVEKDIDYLLGEGSEDKFILPFDSDCIDEDLRHPFEVDTFRFEDISSILDKLKSKKILLSQKVTAPEDTSLNIDTWLLDSNSTGPNITEFIGEVDNMTVKYFDFFNPNLTQFPIIPENLPVDGVSLDDNFPKLYNPEAACDSSESRTQSWFSNPISSSNGSQLNSTLLWSSVCPKSQHMVSPDELLQHRSLHNTYGERSLKTTFENLHNETGDSEMMISSSSIWISSLFYGAFNGLQVPFTWKGLQESVAHTIRNFALAPISGTSICGSPIYNMSLPFSDDLCLRWFQFGLLLPISRNTYDRVSSYGPLDLTNNKYYLAEAIRTRYTFAPYYYTTLYQFQTRYLPYIRPMGFHFHEETRRLRNEVLNSLDQFMIGEAILAAPIIEREVTRRTYFPPGVWYTKEGLEVWNRDYSSFQQITGYISETPMFIRGGHIIPTLDDPMDASTSILESLTKNKYTLLIALSSVSGADTGASQIANGTLTVKDLGVNSFHHVDFDAAFFQSPDIIMISINSTCSPLYFIDEDGNEDNHISTVIDQIKIFGAPLRSQLPEVIVKNGDVEQNLTPSRYGDHYALLVTNLSMDWCGEKNELTTMNDLTTTNQ